MHCCRMLAFRVLVHFRMSLKVRSPAIEGNSLEPKEVADRSGACNILNIGSPKYAQLEIVVLVNKVHRRDKN